MRILITGITGFVGGHLVEALVPLGHALFGLGRGSAWPAPLAHLGGRVELHAGDVADADRVEAVLKLARPDWLVHLAGYANPGRSFLEQDACWRDNLTATRVLYDAVVRTGLRPRILFVSTGLIYGEPDEGRATCDERTTIKPATPYAASKAAADVLSYQYTRSPGLDIVRVRLFNQIGPRQSADYAVANFARQIAAAEAGAQPPVIETGDLSAHRDITDVRDMVAAFPPLLERGRAGEAYNAGRGETYSIRDLLDKMIALARVKVEVRQKPEPERKADTAVTRADARKLRDTTGWVPRIPLEQTLADTLDDWRKATGTRPA
ncbi:nad-dependent epimerase dehydratase : Marine sediment metagenome DNA, contig: S03H2_L04007 (Fragment) OS=marine sediment metagenome GN=S03H2_17566 PE=4 SV=1: Epimerase [Gemmataceae bacterium]